MIAAPVCCLYIGQAPQRPVPVRADDMGSIRVNACESPGRWRTIPPARCAHLHTCPHPAFGPLRPGVGAGTNGTPGRGGGTDDNESEPSGGQGYDAGGHGRRLRARSNGQLSDDAQLHFPRGEDGLGPRSPSVASPVRAGP